MVSGAGRRVMKVNTPSLGAFQDRAVLESCLPQVADGVARGPHEGAEEARGTLLCLSVSRMPCAWGDIPGSVVQPNPPGSSPLPLPALRDAVALLGGLIAFAWAVSALGPAVGAPEGEVRASVPRAVADALAQRAQGAVLHPYLGAWAARRLGISQVRVPTELAQGREGHVALLEALGSSDDLLSTAALAFVCGLPREQALVLARAAREHVAPRTRGAAPQIEGCAGAPVESLLEDLHRPGPTRIGAAFALARRSDPDSGPAICAVASAAPADEQVLLRWVAAASGASCP